jgi:hypothetical protein
MKDPDWTVPVAETEVGPVLNPHWPGAVQERGYVMCVSNTQRTTISTFPEDGGREGL